MSNDLSPRIKRHEFANPTVLAAALAQSVADDLRAALQARDGASLALSGGNTPKAFMQALARQPLDWSRIAVTLVDERWVPENHPRSNAHLLRENLLQGPASAATFLPLYRATPEPEAALDELERDLATSLPWPLDVAVLGMGEDGHTASFFPGGDRLAQALDPAGRARPAHARPGRRRATHHPDPARLAPGHAPVPARGGRGQAPGAGSGRVRGRGRRAFPYPPRPAPCHFTGPDLLVGLRHRRLPCL